MKTRKDYLMRQITDDYILVPTGAATSDFNGLINLSETGAFVWKNLDSAKDVEELIQKMLEEYEVDEETARNDINSFVASLQQNNMLEE